MKKLEKTSETKNRIESFRFRCLCWRGQVIREMFSGRTDAKGYDEWMEAFWKRKYESDFSKEMNRSMEVYLRDFLSSGEEADEKTENN